MSLPAYVETRLRQPPPAGVPVVPGSTPVLSFGPVSEASVATLGLNPSRREFQDRSGAPLTGSKRRLADLSSLGVPGLESSPAEVLRLVVEDCDGYFHRCPYWGWFRQLDAVLDGLNVSYGDGTACHLDLVQWATDPVWNGLPAQQRRLLIEADATFLRQQIAHENIDLVLMNGRAVIEQVRKYVGPLSQVGTVQNAYLTPGLWAGEHDGVMFLGWSCNLQSQPGVTADLRRDLRDAVVQLVQEHRPALRAKGSVA